VPDEKVGSKGRAVPFKQWNYQVIFKQREHLRRHDFTNLNNACGFARSVLGIVTEYCSGKVLADYYSGVPRLPPADNALPVAGPAI
jgi:hypothetical protein